MSQKRMLLSALLGLITAASVSGEIMVEVGSHELLPDTADQQIEVFVTGDERVAGVNFRLQVNDGATGPAITDIDMETGTIFESARPFSSLVVFPDLPTPQMAEAGVLAGVGDVIPDGLLATVTISTVGFESGSFSLILDPLDLGPTEFIKSNLDPVEEVVLDQQGTIQVGGQNNGVPEPTGLLVWSALALLAYPQRTAGKA